MNIQNYIVTTTKNYIPNVKWVHITSFCLGDDLSVPFHQKQSKIAHERATENEPKSQILKPLIPNLLDCKTTQPFLP